MVEMVRVVSDSRSIMKLRISHMLSFNFVRWAFFILLWSAALSDDAVKNHRAEKRQDNSFLFFGGWRPVRRGHPAYHGLASTRYHDIISALPNNYDSVASYYSHALPTQYYKDIYSYYPRPAIKQLPKKNTPVYMERLRPLRQQNKQGSRGGQNSAHQFIDLQNIDFKQLKELHEVILQAKDLPLSHLNVPIESAKPLEIVQLSLQSMQQGNQNYAFMNGNGYGRPRSSQRNRKSGHRRAPHSRRPAQSPIQFEYVPLSKAAPILPQVLPKDIEIKPIQLPQHGHSIEDIIGVKNIQFIEVPSAVPYAIQNDKGSSQSQYSKSGTRSNQQYRTTAQNSAQKGYQTISYLAHQTEQPRKHHAPPQVTSNHIQSQPEIEAELVKLGEEDIKNLLSKLQVLNKNQHDILKYIPVDNIMNFKDENIQFVVSLPESGQGQSQSTDYQNGGYETEKQYAREHQTSQYPSKETGDYGHNSVGYQRENYGNHQNPGHNIVNYQTEKQTSNSANYEQSNYQSLDGQSGYNQQQDYRSNSQQATKGNYQETEEQYSKQNQEVSKGQSGSYGQQEPSYIQVVSPQADENGYRREPVLAVEIQHGQSIEDALKSLDPETLQKIGAHGKDGIEIEVVEVPVDDYASESKKTETVVSARNSTVIVRKKATGKS